MVAEAGLGFVFLTKICKSRFCVSTPLRCPIKSSGLRFPSILSTAALAASALLLPPAARRLATQRATLVGLITRKVYHYRRQLTSLPDVICLLWTLPRAKKVSTGHFFTEVLQLPPPSSSHFSITKKRTPSVGWCSFLVAEAGLEPTTSGL